MDHHRRWLEQMDISNSKETLWCFFCWTGSRSYVKIRKQWPFFDFDHWWFAVMFFQLQKKGPWRAEGCEIFTGALAVSKPSSINCNTPSLVRYFRESSRSFSFAELDLKKRWWLEDWSCLSFFFYLPRFTQFQRWFYGTLFGRNIFCFPKPRNTPLIQ